MPLKLLIAEDEQIERAALKIIISKALSCYEIAGEAKNGAELLELSRTLKPDVLLIDINMPVINGINAITQIKTFLPDAKFIILSAHTDFEYAQSAINLGASAYLTKPVKDEQLIGALADLYRKIVVSNLKQNQYNSLIEELNKLKNQGGSQASPDPAAEPAPIDEIIAFIESNYTTDISLEALASQYNMSTSYLSKAFKQRCNKNYIDYITGLRIEAAKKILANSEKSIKEITFAVGYNSQTYFCKIFKKTTGQSAHEYRQKHSLR